MPNNDGDLFEAIGRHYRDKLGSEKVDVVDVFNEMLDVLARLLATQPNAKVRQDVIAHVSTVLPGLVDTYVDAQLRQRDFGRVAPKPANTILKPTEAEKRFVARAKGDLP